MGKYDGERPENKDGEKKIRKKAFTLDDIGDMPMALTVYPGCIEGDRVTYSVRGQDRAILAYGTAEQIAQYTIGEEVKLSGKAVPEKDRAKYQRNINRKQQEAIDRIKDEMLGTGEVKDLAAKRGGNFRGYALSVNGQRVTGDSMLNSYFVKMGFVQEGKKKVPKPIDEIGEKDKRVMDKDKPVEMMAGIELVVSAIITPGYALQS